MANLLDTYDEVELAIWMAYDEVWGLDDLHLDLSYITTILANANSKKKFKLNDFLNRDCQETFTSDNFSVDKYMNYMKQLEKRASEG